MDITRLIEFHRQRSTLATLAACDGADALVIVTEWKEFRSPDSNAIKQKLKTPTLFDGRNLYDPALVQGSRLEYVPIGRRVGTPLVGAAPSPRLADIKQGGKQRQ